MRNVGGLTNLSVCLPPVASHALYDVAFFKAINKNENRRQYVTCSIYDAGRPRDVSR